MLGHSMGTLYVSAEVDQRKDAPPGKLSVIASQVGPEAICRGLALPVTTNP